MRPLLLSLSPSLSLQHEICFANQLTATMNKDSPLSLSSSPSLGEVFKLSLANVTKGFSESRFFSCTVHLELGKYHETKKVEYTEPFERVWPD